MVHKTTAGLINESFSGVLALKLQQFTHPRAAPLVCPTVRGICRFCAQRAVHDDGDVVGDGIHSF